MMQKPSHQVVLNRPQLSSRAGEDVRTSRGAIRRPVGFGREAVQGECSKRGGQGLCGRRDAAHFAPHASPSEKPLVGLYDVMYSLGLGIFGSLSQIQCCLACLYCAEISSWQADMRLGRGAVAPWPTPIPMRWRRARLWREKWGSSPLRLYCATYFNDRVQIILSAFYALVT